MYSVDQTLKALYLIHGEEELLSIETVDAICQAARNQGFEREVYTVENNFNWQSVLDSVASMSLFSSKKLIQVNIPSGKPGIEGGDALQQLAGNLPEDTVVIVYLPKLERTQQSSKWFTALAKSAEVVESRAVTRETLPRWLRSRLQKHQLDIESDALSLFAERVEGNLLAAKQEVDKLALLFPAQTVLTLENIRYSIAQLARFDVFQLAQSWMSGDAPRLMRLLWAISEDIRSLLRLRAGLAQGKNIAALAGPLRLWGEKKNLAPVALKRIGAKKLMFALQDCAKIDRQIKGAQSGNAWEEIRQLLIGLTQDRSRAA